jgi:hypothetical protein
MRRRIVLWIVSLAVSSAAVSADVLVARDGLRIETKGPWKVKGRVVVFTTSDGSLSSMRVSELDLEASEAATREAAEAAKAAEEAKNRPPAETETASPLSRAILEAYSEEDKTASHQIGHEDVSGSQWKEFRKEVAEVLQRLAVLEQRYDVRTPAGIRAARSAFQQAARDLRRLLVKPVPRNQRTIEGRKLVASLAARLDEIAEMAEEDPHTAIRMLDQEAW